MSNLGMSVSKAVNHRLVVLAETEFVCWFKLPSDE